MNQNENRYGEDEVDEKESKKRLKKRRKTMKSLREYTVHQNEEGKFKGWSSRAAGDMPTLCRKVREGKEDYEQFRKAYHEIYSSRNQGKQKAFPEPIIDVDYSELWDLGDISITEI